MYGFLNILSLILGLVAWIAPMAAIVRKKVCGFLMAISFGLCALALLSQIGYTQHLVQMGDWSAIEDTHAAVLLASSVLVVGTVVLNGLACHAGSRK